LVGNWDTSRQFDSYRFYGVNSTINLQSNKIYQVWSNTDNLERYKTNFDLIGTGWEGYFKPNACEYCDDVKSEIADISLGDVWLPQYVTDPRGTSVIVVRNKTILQILEKYRNEHSLHLEEISNEDAIKSQDGGFPHRREALSYHLAKKDKNDEWFTKKRILANQFNITNKRKKICSLREKIAQDSNFVFLEALQKKDN
jgi:coenzyme F420 hydrogenase subunit beta